MYPYFSECRTDPKSGWPDKMRTPGRTVRRNDRVKRWRGSMVSVRHLSNIIEWAVKIFFIALLVIWLIFGGITAIGAIVVGIVYIIAKEIRDTFCD